MTSSARRCLRCAVLLTRTPRLPRLVKAILAVGLLPIPGPFDEAVLLIAAGVLILVPGWRREVVSCWKRAGLAST